MRYYLAILITAVIFFTSYADDKKDVQTSDKYKQLVEEQKVNELKMLETRIRLIKKDPELEALHRKIIALHKELALKLDKKEEMKKLLDKKKRIGSELERILRKRKTQNASK